jgi:hypothetical protein
MKLLYKPYVPTRVDYLYFANRSIADEQLDYIELFAKKKQ